jgi:hypothetical protein
MTLKDKIETYIGILLHSHKIENHALVLERKVYRITGFEIDEISGSSGLLDHKSCMIGIYSRERRPGDKHSAHIDRVPYRLHLLPTSAKGMHPL